MSFQNIKSEHNYLKSALQARIYDLVKISPLQKMKKISKNNNNIILVKREDLQLIYSFKIRGAYNMISSLSKTRNIDGLVTASAGNHAQGVALSAEKMGIKAFIVMPIMTPNIKLEAVQQFKAKIILYGKNFDESKLKAIEIGKKNKYIYIPPFDHFDIISGQATIAIELLRQDPFIDYIFVPIGGGGLISGISVIIKHLMPTIKIVGVEMFGSSSLKESLKVGYPIILSSVDTFADGVAVKQIGEENFKLCKKYIDDIIVVSKDEICYAIKDIFEEIRIIAEPSGALALAGLKKYIHKNKIINKRLVHILSGANMNFQNLKYVIERCKIHENIKKT